jgi:hypothetical protein
MKQLADRTDWSGPISTAPSTAFVDASIINSIQTELENAVISSGQTLDEVNNYQLARSITDHALGARHSVDTGTVNNYILSQTGYDMHQQRLLMVMYLNFSLATQIQQQLQR